MARPRSTSVDWELIEKHYRAGVMTLRQIAEEYGVAHGSITKRAKTDSWERDLSAKIKAKADSLVSKALASKLASKEGIATEKEVVEANAAAITKIVLDQRADVSKLRLVASGYRNELENHKDDLIKRIGALKALADTEKTLISLERQIFGIDEKAADSSIDAALKRIASEMKNG